MHSEDRSVANSGPHSQEKAQNLGRSKASLHRLVASLLRYSGCQKPFPVLAYSRQHVQCGVVIGAYTQGRRVTAPTLGLSIRPRWGRGPTISFEPEEMPLPRTRSTAHALRKSRWDGPARLTKAMVVSIPRRPSRLGNLFHRKLVYRRLGVGRLRKQHDGREIGMIDRIGIMLGFETKPVLVLIRRPGFTG